MPGIRLFDVRAALAALGLAALAALAIAVVTHLPLPAPGGPPTPASSTGLSRLQSLPLQAQSVISSTIAADSRAFAARHSAAGWGLNGGGIRADFRAGEPTFGLAGGRTLSLSLAGMPASTSVTAHGNRVTLARPGIQEWYAAGPLGIEQGFTLAHRPAAASAHGLTLALAVGGSLRARGAGSDVNFLGSRGGVAARYGGLTAVDATGRHLRSALSVKDGRVLIAVDDRGARYPITIDPLLQQGGKLAGSDAVPGVGGSDFGEGVALSGDGNTALITGDTDNSSKGAAWVFTRTGGVWSQIGLKLVPPNSEEPGDSQFGTSVALSQDGSTALIGANLDNGQLGAAWVYVRSGSTYVDQRKLVGNGETAAGGFGQSVALSANGNTALIGAPADQGAGGTGNGGAAWVFTRSGTTWGTGTKISPITGPMNNNSNFGTGVALSADGTIAMIGGPGDGPGTGAVWVYDFAGSPPTWNPVQRLVPTGESPPSGFGNAIAISGDNNTAVIGDQTDNSSIGGAAWVFTRSGTAWNQQAQLTPNNPTSPPVSFGSSVAISRDGNTALVGAASDANMVGAAYLFTRSAGVWTEQQKITGADEAGGAFFGFSVALASDGQTAMVGGPGDNTRRGAAFPFAPPAPVCNSVSASAPQGGGSVTVSLSCTLPFGASPSYSILGGPSNGHVSTISSAGQLTYTSDALFSGQDSFTYRVNDQWGISNIATATITTPFLPVPKCSNVTAKGKAGATRVTVTLKCTGPKGHPFRYGIVSKPGNGKLGKINQSKGKVTYTTHIGAQGNDRFVYNATNAGGSSKAATATIKLPTLGRITSTMTWPQDFGAGPTSTVVPELIIKNLPGGAHVRLSCSKGCPIKARTVALAKHRVCKGKGKRRKCKLAAPKSGNLDLGRYVKGKRVKVGGAITVAMIQSGSLGKEYVFRMVKNDQPSVKIQTLAPGSTKLCPNC